MQRGDSPTRAASGLITTARQIRWKIIAPYATLTVLIAIAGTFLVTRLVGGSLDERFTNQLAEASRVASDSLVRQERKHLEAVRAVAFTDGVAAGTAANNGYLVAPLVQPIVANAGVGRIEVIGADGRRVYGAKMSDPATLEYALITDESSRSSWPIVADVLAGEQDESGDKYTAILPTVDGYVLYTAGPIFSASEVVGVVLIGTPLPSFLAGAKREALADITIYTPEGAPIASTFATSDDAALALEGASLDGERTDLIRQHKRLYGRDFDLAYTPLLIRGEQVGYLSVGLPSSFIFTARSSTRTQMAILFSVAMLATLLVGWTIGTSLTEPVTKLVTAVNAVSAGDLSARSGVDRDDEIGVLGRAFDAMADRLQHQHLATVKALTSAIDARDPYTMGHSLRVGQLAVELGIALKCNGAQLQHLEIGGYLHDIGKIGVRDSVLLKPGALTLEERRAVEAHPTIGIDILEHVEMAPEVLQFVSGHHEKIDGSGYPAHLHDRQLGIIPRIAAVADIYDALVTDRPYRAGLEVAEAIAILRHEAEIGQLDRDIVHVLEGILPRWEQRRQLEPALRGFRIERSQRQEAA